MDKNFEEYKKITLEQINSLARDLIMQDFRSPLDDIQNLEKEINKCQNINQMIELINVLIQKYNSKNEKQYDYFISKLTSIIKICNFMDNINVNITNDYFKKYNNNKIKKIYNDDEDDDDDDDGGIKKDGGSKCKLNKTDDKIKIIYNKKQYERTIYVNKNKKKFVKINNKQLELSKLKKV